MIDIHSHILFDIDDGARNISHSLELCRDGYENGLRVTVVTPHFSDYRRVASFVREREAKAKELRSLLKQQGNSLAVLTGAELYLNDKIFSADSLEGLTLNNSRYMLCELPLGPFPVNRTTAWIDELISRRYIPVLAHPERYIEFHRNPFIIDELLDRGVLFQVNLDSLIGNNGQPPQMMAVDMVERKIARLIGTDAHNPVHRHNRIKEKFKELPPEITEEMIAECMGRVPDAILRDKEIF